MANFRALTFMIQCTAAYAGVANPVVKHIERLIRRGTLAIAARLPRSGAGAARTDGMAAANGPGAALARLLQAGQPRILLVRTDRIGDAVITTPLITLLRQRYPQARIDLLLGRKNAAAAPLMPGLDAVLVPERGAMGMLRMLMAIRRTRYDAAVNLLVNDSASATLITLLSGASVRIGFAGQPTRPFDIGLDRRPRQPMHVVQRTALLAAPFGIEPGQTAPPLRITLGNDTRGRGRRAVRAALGAVAHADTAPGEALAGTVLLNVSGSGPEKYWGRENFVALAIALAAAGLRPIIAGRPDHAGEVAAIAQEAGCARLAAAGALEDFAAAIACCALVVTPDTSVVHIAAALGRPTVVLVAEPEVGNNWGPWGVTSTVIAGTGLLDSIVPEHVAEAVVSLAGATWRPPSPLSSP